MNFLRTTLLAVLLLSSAALADNENSDKYTTPIVQKGNGVTSPKTLSYEELRAIFTLSNTRWPDGTKITVVILPDDHPVQKKFMWEYFGISAARYSEIVANRTQPGMTAKKPYLARSEIEVIQKVSHTKGAIGFLGQNFRLSKNENTKAAKIQ